jgi:hypothetical protein
MLLLWTARAWVVGISDFFDFDRMSISKLVQSKKRLSSKMTRCDFASGSDGPVHVAPKLAMTKEKSPALLRGSSFVLNG